MVGHEDIAAGMVEAIECDCLHAHARKANSRDRAPGKEFVEHADVAGNKSPGETNQRCERHRDCPEEKHDRSADHFACAPVDWTTAALSASPFNHAARRARCAGVTCS